MADTIIARFMKQAEIRPDAPAYHVKEGGSWKATSWSDYVKEVRTAARALLSLGVGRKHENGQSDPSCVCILGFNRPEWTIMDLACMAVGGAPAGIYTTCSPPEVAYIVRHTEAKVVLVENGLAKERRVEVGERTDGFVEIRSGLEAGEAVVLAPTGALTTGTPVRVGGTDAEAR